MPEKTPERMPKRDTRPGICDYEGSNYRTDFWEGRGRDYEDRVERLVLRRLLPSDGTRLLEIGAGFGRLTEEYRGYRQVVLLDYSFSQLQYAQERYGRSGRFIYVAADAYQMPFSPGMFDGASMVRVIHHMADVPRVLAEVRRVLTANGVFILEFANKRNLKAMVRYATRKQSWNPYDPAPVEFVELNFDFHPTYIQEALKKAGFTLQTRIPVSFFRLDALKQRVPTGTLVTMDSVLQRTGLTITPSIFNRCVAVGDSQDNTMRQDIEALFVCPASGMPVRRDGDVMVCDKSGLRYAVRDGIYDFKAPLDEK